MSRKNNIFLGLILVAALLSANPAFSGVLYEAADGLSEGLSYPVDVAVSATGAVYVADAVKDQILIYNNAGGLTGEIEANNPDAVAVGDNGTVYVAVSSDLSVRMYNPAGVFFGVLGSGANEFKLPKNIGIDNSTGDVYVVDALDHSIKVYTASGAFIKRIDDDSSLPQDVAVTATGIFVADQPLVDGWYGKHHGSRVRVYDLAGNPVRSFGESRLSKPRGITIDSQGVIYVTDTLKVNCFNIQGDYLGAVADAGQPQGLDISGAGRLYVTTPFSDNEKVKSYVITGVE